MSTEDFQGLKDSIENIGVQNPITIFEGMVVDGWNRYKAANELGMDCPSKELDAWIDPVAFVRAQNKDRRHLPLHFDKHGPSRLVTSEGLNENQ